MDCRVLSHLALVYRELGEVDKAKALLERATQQNPESVELWVDLAERIYSQHMGRRHEAEGVVKRMERLRKASPSPRLDEYSDLVEANWLLQGGAESGDRLECACALYCLCRVCLVRYYPIFLIISTFRQITSPFVLYFVRSSCERLCALCQISFHNTALSIVLHTYIQGQKTRTHQGNTESGGAK